MKATFRAVLATALLAAAALAPALAQENQVVGTLHVDANPVMVSSGGGDFVSVSGDTALHVGDRITIADEGRATLTYNNGVVLHYESPGVYTVQMAPAGSVGSSGGMSAGATAGVIIGAAALAGAAIDQNGDVVPPDQPVSP